MLSAQEVKDLKRFSVQVRMEALKAIGGVGVGHIGGSLSLAELMAVLYNKVLKVDPRNPKWEQRDYLVVSKGHSGPAVYATLALKGFFPLEMLKTLNQGGTCLPSHCDRLKTPGIDMSTGSLGQGASSAAGIALGFKLGGKTNRVYLVLGDGECQEGQVWEMVMFANHQHLSNLIAFVDDNKQEVDGFTRLINDLGDLPGKFSAFGWFVQKVDGHDVQAIHQAVENAQAQSDRPSMIVLDTVKGRGVLVLGGQSSESQHPHQQGAAGKRTGRAGCSACGDWLAGRKTAMTVILAKDNIEEKTALRDAYVQAMMEAAELNERVLALDADLMLALGLGPFTKKFPARAINVGVQEANMYGVCAGLSLVGYVPYAHTFACFASRRAFDQIFMSCAYAKLNVRVVGSDPGVTAMMNGGTHMAFEDIALMRAVPQMTILEPVELGDDARFDPTDGRPVWDVLHPPDAQAASETV